MNNKFNEQLGDWSESAARVKKNIYQQTIEGKKKKRKPHIFKISVAAALVTATIGGAYWWNIAQNPPAQIDQVEVPTEIEKEQANFRTFNENFIKIAHYEQFFRSTFMYSNANSLHTAYSDAISAYAVINHLADYDVVWDEEKRAFYRNQLLSALEYDLRDAHFAAYFEQMLATLDITKEQYVDDYQLVVREAEVLENKMHSESIGLQESESGSFGYEVSKEQDEFTQRAGIPSDFMEYLAVRSTNPISTNEKAYLPWTHPEYGVRVVNSPQNELILADHEFPLMYVHDDISEFFYLLQRDKRLPELTRMSYPQYVAEVQQLENSHPLKAKLLDMFAMIERSLEWTYEPITDFTYALPTFPTEGLRVHHDKTLEIVQYEFYSQSPMLYDHYVAYRNANEWLNNAYGLFNDLALTHNYRWSKEKRQQVRSVVVQQLEERLQQPYYASYIEKLCRDLAISKDEYIDYYLLIDAEYEQLKQEMLTAHIGVTEHNRYSFGEQSTRYREAVGLTWSHLQEKMEEIYQQKDAKVPLDTQPTLDIETTEPVTMTKTAKGDVIMAYPFGYSLYLPEEQQAYVQQVQQQEQLPELTRITFPLYEQAFAEQLHAFAPNIQKLLALVKEAIYYE